MVLAGLSPNSEVGDVDRAVEKAAIFDKLLAVAGHHALRRGVAVRVEHGRSAEQRDVRGVEVAAVQSTVALEAHQDLAIREEGILVELQLALDGTGIGDANVDSIGGEDVRTTEVVQLLELAGDIRRSDHPVGRSAQRGPVDDVGDFQGLVEQRDVAVDEVHRSASSRCEVVGRTDTGGDDQVVDDFTVDLSDDLITHQVGQGGLSVHVVHGLEILSRLKAPRGLQFAGDSRN